MSARDELQSRIYDSLAAFNGVACWDVLRLAQMRQYLAEHLVDAFAEQAAEIDRLRAELAKYVGFEPTVADESAYLTRCLNAVLEVCDAAEKQATRWEQPLPVPEWVATVREAADGERPENPEDNRRRIYIDGEGNGWISTCVDDGVECVVPVQPAAEVEQEITELDGLHEIGRCW